MATKLKERASVFLRWRAGDDHERLFTFTFTLSFSRRFCPKQRTRERIVKLRAIEPGVTINTTLHKKYNKVK